MDSQDEGHMYFTSLLSQDGTSHVSLDDSPPLPLDNPTGVKISNRGANFTIEEDKLLVSAWLNCSTDGVKGTDQKHSQLWEKILGYFEEFKVTTTERTSKSLIQRWSLIQKATNKFCGKIAQVKGLNQSGMIEQDKLEKAKIMYSSLEKCNFQFEHCWNLLKEEPKWLSLATKGDPKQRKRVFPYPKYDLVSHPETNNVRENEVIELDWPMGRKAEKQKRKPKQRKIFNSER